MPKRHCKAKTRSGKRCRAHPQHDRDVCLAHDVERRASVSFSGPEAGRLGGRPPNPRVVDVLRQRIEEEIDRVLAPLFEGLDAERGLVVGDGPTAHIEYVKDMGVRLKAVRELLDRAYGRPPQSHEIKRTPEESEIDRAIRELLEQFPVTNGNRAHA